MRKEGRTGEDIKTCIQMHMSILMRADNKLTETLRETGPRKREAEKEAVPTETLLVCRVRAISGPKIESVYPICLCVVSSDVAAGLSVARCRQIRRATTRDVDQQTLTRSRTRLGRIEIQVRSNLDRDEFLALYLVRKTNFWVSLLQKILFCYTTDTFWGSFRYRTCIWFWFADP